MKEIRRREIELLAKICYENNFHLKLAKDLIKVAERLSYENVSQGARIKEYQELIDFHIKNSENNNQ
ncbi:DNA modification system-associated small protein [Neobacillus sp. M.A.Huq-85]